MKRLLLSVCLFLLLTSPVPACDVINTFDGACYDHQPVQLAWMGALGVGQGVGAAAVSCDSCNSGTDSAIASSGNTHGSEQGLVVQLAFTFTTVATKCVTGISVWAHDGGNDRGLTCEIWSDSSGVPGSIFSEGMTGTAINIADTLANNEMLFSSTQILVAGTYWAVCSVVGGTIFFGHQTDGPGPFKYYTGAAWDDTSWDLDWGVLGCDQS